MSETLWTVGLLAGLTLAIGVLAWTCLKIRDWYRDDTGHADDPAMFLTALHESTRRGDVTEEEYRTIQGRLRGSISDRPRSSDSHPTSDTKDDTGTVGESRSPEANETDPPGEGPVDHSPDSPKDGA